LTNGDEVSTSAECFAHFSNFRDGVAGSAVQLVPAELTNRDGSVTQISMNANHNSVRCEFIKSTDVAETWSPKFFYIGCPIFRPILFRPVLAGDCQKSNRSRASLLILHLNPSGNLNVQTICSTASTRSSVGAAGKQMSLMTDCPHRERLGC